MDDAGVETPEARECRESLERFFDPWGMTDAEAIAFYRGFLIVVILLDIAFATWTVLVWLGIVEL